MKTIKTKIEKMNLAVEEMNKANEAFTIADKSLNLVYVKRVFGGKEHEVLDEESCEAVAKLSDLDDACNEASEKAVKAVMSAAKALGLHVMTKLKDGKFYHESQIEQTAIAITAAYERAIRAIQDNSSAYIA